MKFSKPSDYPLTFGSHQVSALTTYSYVADWLVYILVISVVLTISSTAEPNYHEFSLNDYTLMHTFKSEVIINLTALISISVGIPVLVVVILSLFNSNLSKPRRAWDIFIGLLVLCGSMATQLTIVNLMKNVCGLPRPDLISRCFPVIPPDYDSLTSPGTLVHAGICTPDDPELLRDGFRSFPSGHSATVFCGMVLTSLNLCGKLQVFDQRGVSLNVVSASLPIILACYVACTRVSDNRHFLRDITSGAIIGTAVSVWFYLQYFPSIFDLRNCGRAYPPRRFGIANFFDNVGGFWRINDVLNGSFIKRELNSIDSLNKLKRRCGHTLPVSTDPRQSGDPLGPEPEVFSLATKIEIVNKLHANAINLDS